MRILSVSAQKPSSTGSGVFLSELVKDLDKKGHEQVVVAGVYRDDEIIFPESVSFQPVYFDSSDIPFHIVGMSDEMPYPNTRYCDMTDEMVTQFEEGFLKVLRPVIEEFKPDLILSHHLYLLTSILREHFPTEKIYGFCHNTDLRQLEKNQLCQSYIKNAIKNLDKIFALHEQQKERVMSLFSLPETDVYITGMGYNSDVFKIIEGEKKNDSVTRVVFAGKIAEKKGVISLIRAMDYLNIPSEELEFYLAGGAGNEVEYELICSLASKAKYAITFLGRLSQVELAKIYNRCDIFILPSYYEGLPLTVIEALACGNRVVVSDIPGVKDWLLENTKDADIRYVTLPTMVNTDEPIPEELPGFEQRLALALTESIIYPKHKKADVSKISWTGIVDYILNL